jgi:NAD(P)-dependent dehydrogenase (short-subunit alcohol dehydrogenase family)
MKLKDKVAIITGGGRGLGRASAVAMAQEGASVAVLSRTESELEETARLVEETGSRALILPFDIADDQTAYEVVSRTVSDLGDINILMNSAAVVGPAAFLHEVDQDGWDYTMAVNLTGALLICQEVVPSMIKTGGGRIINVTSGLARITMPLFGAYSVSKAALNHTTLIMAEELRAYGIQVNGVDPGVMDTRMQAEIREMGPEILGKTLHDRFLSFKEGGHLRQPEEVAKLAVFLSSDEAVGVSGEIGGEAEFKEYGYGLNNQY